MTVATESSSSLIAMSRQQYVQVIIAGAIIGLVVWGVSILLENYVFQALLCRDGGDTMCGSATSYAQATAMILSGIAGLLALIRLQTFRPLLVVLAAVLSLWGVTSVAMTLPWYGAALSLALLFALAYGLFSWVVRLRSFIMVAVIVIVLVVISRLILS